MICVAPGLFSTTTGCPQISDRRPAIDRDSASVAPPAVAGTTIFTGLEGNGCASASDAQSKKTGTDHVFLIYSITLSARRRIACGIVSPSAFAVRAFT